MTLSYILRVMGKGVRLAGPADYSSKQNSGKRVRFSSILSISTGRHEYGRTPLPISHVCVSGEADLRPWLVLRKKRPKSQHVVNCQTTETRQLLFIRRRVRHISSCLFFIEKEDIIWDTKKSPNSKVMPRREHREKRKNFSLEWAQTPRYGEPC